MPFSQAVQVVKLFMVEQVLVIVSIFELPPMQPKEMLFFVMMEEMLVLQLAHQASLTDLASTLGEGLFDLTHLRHQPQQVQQVMLEKSVGMQITSMFVLDQIHGKG